MSFVSSKGNILCRLIKIELYKIFAIINRAIKGLHCNLLSVMLCDAVILYQTSANISIRPCFYQTESTWSMDQGSIKKSSGVKNSAPQSSRIDVRTSDMSDVSCKSLTLDSQKAVILIISHPTQHKIHSWRDTTAIQGSRFDKSMVWGAFQKHLRTCKI